MWIYILMILTSCLTHNTLSESFDQNDDTDIIDELPSSDELQTVTPQNAIIAIQIINSTSKEQPDNSKSTSKRTIEASLGYGSYQGNNFYYKPKDGKFEIYPYSQHDIPPYNPQKNLHTQPAQSFVVGKTHPQQHPHQQNHLQSQKPQYIQQSASGHQQKLPIDTQQYHLPSQASPEHSVPTHSQYNIPQYMLAAAGHYQQQLTPTYQGSPTTLFSTFNHGQIGTVSPHIPTQFVQYPVHGAPGGQHKQVPVIILRVYSDQLQNPQDFYPNLPADNPYANYLNSINLQTLLSGYIQQNAQLSGHPLQHESHATDEGSSLPLDENYPDDSHTKVIIPAKKSSAYKKHKVSVTSENVTPLPSLSSKSYAGPPYLPTKQSVQVTQPSAYIYATSTKSTSAGTKSQMAYAYTIPGKSEINSAAASSNPHITSGHNLNMAYPESTPLHPVSTPQPAYLYSMPYTYNPQSAYMYTQDGGLTPVGNAYSVPVPQAPNYYNTDGANGGHSTENIQLMHLQLNGNHLSQNVDQQTGVPTQQHYVYINENDVQRGGIIYQDPRTKQLMYLPQQTQNAVDNVKYISPEEYYQQLFAQQYADNAQYKAVNAAKVSVHQHNAAAAAVRPEKSVSPHHQLKPESSMHHHAKNDNSAEENHQSSRNLKHHAARNVQSGESRQPLSSSEKLSEKSMRASMSEHRSR